MKNSNGALLGEGNPSNRWQLEPLEPRLLLSASLVSSATAAASAHPTMILQGISPDIGSPPSNAFTPSQINSAYGFNQVLFGSVHGTGSGQTVAIIDAYDDPAALNDLNVFSQQFSLPLMNQSGGPTFTKVGQTGGAVPGTDPAGAGNHTWEEEESLDIEWVHAIAPQANILLVEGNSPSMGDLVQTAVPWAASQTGVVAVSMSFSAGEFSGENSYDSCFTTPSGHAGVTFFASTGDGGEPAGYPAYSPNVVAVGGTSLTLNGSTYQSESGWSGSGGGISTIETQPSYQNGVVTQSATMRTAPDVSMDANPSTGVAVYDSYDYPGNPWVEFGGTSVSCPLWAGLMAVVDQGRGLIGLSSLDGPTGTLPALYQLPTADFHDVTSGSNGYSAGAGYDLVTGLGTPVANKLIPDLAGQPSKLAFTQQPTSTAAGAAIDAATGVRVAVEDMFGNTFTADTSNVTLTLNGGTFASGGNTVTVAAVNGVATFNNLIINAPGNYTLTAGDGALILATSRGFAVFGAAAKLSFTRPPTNALVGTAILPAVAVAVQDPLGSTVVTDNSTVTLTLSSGTFASGGSTVTATAVNGIATFSNLVINVPGNYTLAAGDGALAGATSSSFAIVTLFPRILSINRESPTSASTEAASVTYAVAFNEPVTGVTSADFQLVFTGGASASSTVVVSPGGGYSSAYDVTVNNISGKGTLGLNLVDNGSIVDAYGSHLTSSGSFLSQQTFATGTNPMSLAVADVNGDGNPDLIAVNYGSATVSMLLGNGDGTFKPQRTFITSSYPESVAVADVNGDGKPDLVVTGETGNVGVLLGNGNGTFQAQQTFSTGSSSNPDAVAVADLNGDGKPDLVVTNNGSGNVGVLLGNGDGTFQAQRSFATGSGPESVVVADVNGDGKPDLAVANSMSNSAGVLLGNGDGTFQAQQTFSTGSNSNPASVAVADVNGDGKLDLATANDGSNNASILLGNGDGTFQAQKTFATGSTPRSVAIADMNGDGAPDLVVANGIYGNGTITVLLSNGDGTFQAQQPCPAGSVPVCAAAADVNGDGKPDLVAANEYGNTLSVLLGNFGLMGQIYTVDQPGQLAFSTPPASTAAGSVIDGSNGVQVAVEDSGGATVAFDSSVVTLTLNGGDFASGGSTLTATAVNGVATFNNLIINAPGNYTLTASDGALAQVASQGFTIFAPAAKLGFMQQPTQTPAGVLIKPGVAVAVQDPFGNTVVTDHSTVTLTLSSGTFASGGTTATATAVNGIATFSNLVINVPGNYTLSAGDGALTGATSSGFTIAPYCAVLSINRESPAGTVADGAGVTYAVTFGEPVTGVTSASFQLALAGGASASSTVAVSPAGGYSSVYHVTVNGIRGNGTLGLNLVDSGSIVDQAGNHMANASGTFLPQQTFATSWNCISVAVADLNGDGKPDLVAVNGASNDVSVLMGNGDGTFQPQKTYALGTYPEYVAVADVNGDGKLDLAVTNFDSFTVGILLGNGDGTFQAQRPAPSGGANPGFVVTADMNGDGVPDLVIAYPGGNGVTVQLGVGDGTFHTKGSVACSNPQSVAVADVNGDGKPDVVIPSWNTNSVSVALGNGDGTLQAPKTFAAGTGPFSVAVADVNGDGKPDLAVANQNSDNVSLLLGNGNGTFQAQTTLAAGKHPQVIAAADVNGDGKPDLVVTDEQARSLSLMLGNGDGTFQAQKTFSTGTGPSFVVAADVNGDGKPDLIVSNYGDNDVGVLLAGNSFTGQVYIIDSATRLAFTQYPASTTAGNIIDNPSGVQVAVKDSSGATIGGDSSVVTLTLNGGTFASGGNTVAVAAINGVATFNNLVIDAAGSYTLTAGDGSLATATSSSFTISAAAAAKLAFTQQPSNVTVGAALSPALTVAVQDSFGNKVATNSSSITLTLSGGTFAGGGSTATATAAGGIATFNNLIVSATGNYTLTAADGSLAGATSVSFTICPLGDVNLDGVIDAADIDAVYAHFGAANTSQWKVCGDGNPVGQADVDYLVKSILHTSYGDANLDRKVDFVDFQVLLDHWAAAGQGWAAGDFTGDGKVDFTDFQKLLDNWNPGGFGTAQQSVAAGTVSAAGTAAVAAQVADLAVAAPAATLSVAAAPAVSTVSATATEPADHSVNLLSRRAVGHLRHWVVSIQGDDADTVDLLTQLHTRPVVA